MTKKVIVLPQEVNELALKVSANKQQEVQTVLTQIFTGTDEWEAQVDAIEVRDINDIMSINLADTARLNSKKARLSAEKIFDAKRDEVQSLKAEYDVEDKLWLKAKQVMQIKFKAIEEKAEWKANFVKRFEAEQKEVRTQRRINEVSNYAELNRIEFENMSDESFESFLSGLQSSYEAKIESEKKAEAERLEAIRIENERIEAQRIENAKLKVEAEKREKEIEAERVKAKIEADRIAKENEAKLKVEADLLAKERVEKAKIEAELKAKKEAELKLETDRKEAEMNAQKEAEKNAKAPIKKQLITWVNDFAISNPIQSNEKSDLIIQKFLSFKKWALSEIESL